MTGLRRIWFAFWSNAAWWAGSFLQRRAAAMWRRSIRFEAKAVEAATGASHGSTARE
jgi:hypothetical protein